MKKVKGPLVIVDLNFLCRIERLVFAFDLNQQDIVSFYFITGELTVMTVGEILRTATSEEFQLERAICIYGHLGHHWGLE